MKYFLIIIFIFSLFFSGWGIDSSDARSRVTTIAHAAESTASDACVGLSSSVCIDNNHPTCCLNGTTCQTGDRSSDSVTQIGTCASLVEGVDTLNGDLINPLSGSTDVVKTTEVVARVVRWIFAIVGALALLMFIIGGTFWIVSFGNETRITKGRQIIIWASVGLLLIFSSYAIINFVLGSLVG